MTDRAARRGRAQTVLGHIVANVVPTMRRRGFSEAEIQAIVVDNPRRLLTVR